MTGFFDFSVPDRLDYSAAVFAQMRAVRIAAGAEIRSKLGKRARKIGGFHKIKAHKIQHAKAGRIGNQAAKRRK